MAGCCFTGYRPEKSPFPYDRENKEYIGFENSLISAIAAALSDGYDTFYCGGAMGFDLLAAELLLLFKKNNSFRLVMVLPFRTQDSAFPSEWKKRFTTVLSSADEVICLSEKYYKGCYFDRNHFMVDRSGRVIAFYDGKAGGTRDTVRYAEKNGVEVVNLATPKKENLNYTIFEVLDTPETEE